MHRTLVSICALLGVLACVVNVGCGTIASSTISVSIMSPASAETIDQGQTVSVTASVSSSNGSTINQSVTWSISGSACTGAACGSLTNQTATSVTYIAPSSVLSNTVVSVVATSAENLSKSASIQITVAAIAIQIQNKVSELAAGTGNFFNTQFVALVQNDPTGAGVTWTLTANGAQCSPACGTLTVSRPQSVTYAPPASVPATPANMATLTATSVTNPSESVTDAFTIFNGAAACGTGGNESELNGEYAIMLQGWSGTGAGSPFLFGASFGADGAGHITGGADQFNPFFNHSESGAGVIQSASSYSVSSDNRGCLTLTDQNEVTYTFQFSLGGITAGIASKGDIIYFNQQSATPQRGSGILRKQDATAFSLSALAPNYALGVDGWANASSSSTVLVHYAAAGSFTQSGGTLSNPAFDANDGGSMTTFSEQGLTNFGTIQGPISTGTGTTYATISLPGPSGGEADVTVYVINSSELFFISNDLSETGVGALFCGRAIATPSSFTAASISPNYILRFTGNSSSSAAAAIGLASFSGGAEGNVSGVFDHRGYGYQSKHLGHLRTYDDFGAFRD